MSEFQKGDLVHLKSGGPKMTINFIQQDTDTIECVYFNGTETVFLDIQKEALEKV